ncbi:undecaprenyldiphospho-muramoylpentapeptide beta-N-acetylglucosaminyltransferase [Kordiimonas aestuarii]|uniref:undecaprenyldiphospho-muramoylpentapeptide beta-N-acetylglucosaminyltransferase n=1 Tax=Kordiimonas aestuarii TaxID=1005925 RepID=UPI0021D221F7|nr:undecaprenyldiphospho-muramoylpentapeptide beta-N-acetylglucosaminyltransferase [Kordiimonas aestuarii]
MNTAPYIVLAAGGTGGHMMPAEAVSDVLNRHGYDVLLVTDARGDAIRNAMVDANRYVLKTSSHMGGGLGGKVRSVVSIIRSTLQVRGQFKRRRPSVVVGFGGYPSLPAVLAARSQGVPYVLHEQNAVLGRVNRLMAEGAKVVALSLENSQRVPKAAYTEVTGNPVRHLISKLSNIAYSVPFGFGDIRLLVIGGSQGARILSDVVPAALAALSDDLRSRVEITHQARAEDVERVQKAYAAASIKHTVQSYFDDVGALLLRCQLVICRSGASTVAELSAMGRPAIMVPLAIAADDHQSANAGVIERAGGGWVMKEKDFKADALAEKLQLLLTDPSMLRDASDAMREVACLDAAERLASIVESIAVEEGAR